MKPPELKYKWHLGRARFLDLIRAHLPDGITYSLNPEVDEDDPELNIPSEEYRRPYPDIHAALFGMAPIDSILGYLGVPVTDKNRLSLEVDCLCDNQSPPRTWPHIGLNLHQQSSCGTTLFQAQGPRLTQRRR